jgi:hypothetical protein
MRDDVSNKLVHLTKGNSTETSLHRSEACIILIKIMTEKTLNGDIGCIKGKHKCVCFSEAPISKFSYLLYKTGISEGDLNNFQYQPYGVMVDKKWLFSKGGRPVIYGEAAEYSELPEGMRYRHVRYEPTKRFPVDHTDEREWRIKIDFLKFTSNDVTIIVPDRIAKEEIAKAFPNDDWHFMVLSDLGVPISPL